MSSNDKSTKEASSVKVSVAMPKAAGKKKEAKTVTVKARNVETGNVAATDSEKTTKTAKTEVGLVVRDRAIDPELDLMASRTAAREKTRPDVTRMKQNGRSMSGMVTPKRSHYQPHTAYSINAQHEKAATDERHESKAGGVETSGATESRFSKVKSALIGVGVALVVAVVGFAGIAMFGNNKKMCTVHFESNGGSEVAGTEIVCGRAVTEPNAPVKEGFSFEGWMLDGDLFDFTKGVYKNATLVARWKADEGTEVVTVRFDSDGGTKVDDVKVAKGKKISRPNTPKRYGYAFDDWYLGDKVYDFDQLVNSDITLKAKWVPRPAVVENNGGQSGSNNKPIEKKYAESLEVGDAKVYAGENVAVTVTVLPSAAETRLAMVSSSDEGVATCSITNTTITCTGHKPGEAIITVKDDLSGVKKEFKLVVEEKPSAELPVEPQPNPGEDDETDGSGDTDDSGDTGGSAGGNGDSGETGGSGSADGGAGDTGGTGGGAGSENQGDNPQPGQSSNSGTGA